ncbi:helix-turn-helix domain-containing protein [Pseudofrankia inefficax]|uniref:Helix-turn-helix domain protein n=1 Tax=Pseudofrankia inefficax (strain DSM 45817 / CECT 9037 / DDB 130130 / EuI1c) TaxID=298654 RepID=E3J7B0_PSEI1|nr:helix-turn-helix transcriptional regulator [Pseudofrankia inefficax]ADP78383.1 helix-turn-helix domain protein [Pseudofrankia inefficax]
METDDRSGRHHDPSETVGAALARLRRESGLTGVEVAKRSGVSQGQISKIENSRVTPSQADVVRFAGALDLPGALVADLVERSRQAQALARERRRGANRSVAANQEDYLEEEGRARHLRAFEPILVPGLLQTSEYARRVINRFYAVIYGDDRQGWPDTAAAVRLRLERQERLYDPDRDFKFIISESALRARFGAKDYWPLLMAAQIQRIESACELPNVEIRIVPTDTSLPFPAIEPFEIMDDAVVITESTAGSSRRDRDGVEIYARVFDRFWSSSTPDVLPILSRYKTEFLEESTKVAKSEDAGTGQ